MAKIERWTGKRHTVVADDTLMLSAGRRGNETEHSEFTVGVSWYDDNGRSMATAVCMTRDEAWRLHKFLSERFAS